MLGTVKGIDRDGQIQCIDLPQDIDDASGKVDLAKLRHLIEKLETIEEIQKGFDQLNSDQNCPKGR